MTNPLKTNLHKLHPTSVFIAVSNWLQLHPRTVRHAMRMSVVVMLSFTLLNAGVFTVQHGRTTAFTQIDGQDYGLMSIADAKKQLQEQTASAQLTISIGGKTVLLNPVASGVVLDTDKTFEVLTSSNGWRRVPVVSAVGNLFADIKPQYDIDMEQLAASLVPYVTNHLTPAKDAQAVIPADPTKPVTITPEVAGSELTAVIAAESLAESIRSGSLTTKIIPAELEPQWKTIDLTAFLPAIEAARSTSLTLKSGDKEVVLSSEVLAPMLRVDTSGSVLKMSLDTAKLKASLDLRAAVFYDAPVAATTVQKDGVEVSRNEGVAGKQLDTAATAAQATAAFEKGVLSVAPAIAALTPEVLVRHTYSNTDKGLEKLLGDFAASHRGSYHIAAVELKGPGHRSAFFNADSQVITASTYKLFLAYGILQRIEQGTLTMESPTSEGTVKYCIERMIHLSTNECGIALQSVLGWAEFDKKLIADGFTATTLNNWDARRDKHSTARDEMKLLNGIYNHELLNPSSSDYLQGLMKNQIWRSGIPAGSRGAIVADKVGYLDGLFHDIGIVYSPKSTYILAIMTENSGGWGNIRELAGQVYDFYNQ